MNIVLVKFKSKTIHVTTFDSIELAKKYKNKLKQKYKVEII